MEARRIFIAEDDESISVLLEFLMRKLGHATRTVRDGGRAIEALEEFQPHLALLDLMLPSRSGLEICHAIRAHGALRETRVLMLTAKGSLEDVARALAAGADEYVVKPFSTHELAARVEAHRAHIMEKLEVNSVAELVQAVMEAKGATPGGR